MNRLNIVEYVTEYHWRVLQHLEFCQIGITSESLKTMIDVQPIKRKGGALNKLLTDIMWEQFLTAQKYNTAKRKL